jgi:hypothetical protein
MMPKAFWRQVAIRDLLSQVCSQIVDIPLSPRPYHVSYLDPVELIERHT